MFLSKDDTELNEIELKIKRLEQDTGITFFGNINDQEDLSSYMDVINEFRKEMTDNFDNK